MSVEITGLDEWDDTLRNAQKRIVPEVKKTTGKACNNIKTDARRRVTGLAHAPAYPYAIGYDVTSSRLTVTGEVGPDKNKRQGALGNLIELGSINNPPRPHMAPATDREVPVWQRYVEDVSAKLLEG